MNKKIKQFIVKNDVIKDRKNLIAANEKFSQIFHFIKNKYPFYLKLNKKGNLFGSCYKMKRKEYKEYSG